MVSWIGGNGDWYDPSNWSTGNVPTANDDVTIESSGTNITVSFSQGDPAVRSLSLFANNGGYLDLSGLTTYQGSSRRNTTFKAEGAGSRINLSGITELKGGSHIYRHRIETLNGGAIDLSNVTEITEGATRVYTEGSNSTVNLANLRSFVDDAFSTSYLSVKDGGTIQAGNLTTLDNVDLYLQNSSNLETAQITSLTGESSLTAEGTNPDLTGLSNIDGLNFVAKAGATIDLSHIGSYKGSGDRDTVFKAEGAGSQIDLSGIAEFSGGTHIYEHSVDALDGGSVDLSSITAIATGATRVHAEGTNSTVNLANLQSFADDAFSASFLSVKDGGTIQANNLTTLENIDFHLGNGGNLETAQITSITGKSTVTAYDTNPNLTGLSNIDGLNFVAKEGATIDLSHITTYQGSNNWNTTFKAEGTDSKIDLSGITELSGGTHIYEHEIEAFDGGSIDLSNATAITGGATEVYAKDADSTINLANLQSFVDDAFSASFLSVRDGGTIQAGNLTTLENVDFHLRSGGNLETAQITSLTGKSTVNAYGTNPDFTGLSNIDGLSFVAEEGATLDLSHITTYQGTNSWNTLFKAGGTGSKIDLSGITELKGGSHIYEHEIKVVDGGLIDLSKATAIAGGATEVYAEDANSTINLSNLQSFVDDAYSASFLSVKDGGTIQAGNLTNLDNVNLYLRSGSNLETAQISNLTGSSSVTAEGTNPDLTGLSNIDGLSFVAEDGATIALSHISSYKGSGNRNTTFKAEGTGSKIDLSGMTELSGGTGIYEHEIYALKGGAIDLSQATAIAGGATEVYAKDVNSTVNLSNLQSFVDDAYSASFLSVQDGGTIQVDRLATVDNVDLTNNASTLLLPSLQKYLGNGAIAAKKGGQLRLESISELSPDTALDVLSDGSGSLVALPAETAYLPVVPEEKNGGEILIGGQTLDELPFTIASGVIDEDTTWDGFVKVLGNVTVARGVTLSIEEGTVVKAFNQNAGLGILGNLDVQGSQDDPVIFTSWLDDTANADTDGNGNSTVPTPQSWKGLSFINSSAKGNLENVEIRYAEKAIEGVRGAKIDLSNAKLTDNGFGVYVYSPLVEVTAENLLVARNEFTGIFMRADSRGVYRNATITENGFAGSGWHGAGIHLGGANLTVENSIVAFNKDGLNHSGDPPLTNFNHTIFHNPDGEEIIWDNDPNKPDLTQDGNKTVDPLFINRDAGDYTLLPGSPAIDAGTGTDALGYDLDGKERSDDPGIANTGDGTPDYVDIGAYEYSGHSLTPDLAVTGVVIPTDATLSAGDSFTAQYTVTNLGEDSTAQNWVDRVYLSSDRYISPDDVLLETVVKNQSLAFGESYTQDLNVTVPSTAGPQHLLVLTDADRTIAEQNEVNNLAASRDSLSVDVPQLTLGNDVAGEVRQGEWTYFQFTAEPGQPIRLDLDALNDAGDLDFYIKQGEIPDAIDYDDVASEGSQSDREMRILQPTAGTYYLGVYGNRVPGGSTSVNLSAELTQPALYSLAQTSASSGGSVTLELIGDNFSPDDVITLVAPDGVTKIAATQISNPDPTRTYATFDLDGVDLGDYDVVVETSGGDVLTLADALTVTPPATEEVKPFFADLTVPDYVRPGREVIATLEYGNLLDRDLTSPLLKLESDYELEWQIPGTDEWVAGNSINLMALSTDGPANILRPGETESVQVKFRTPFSTGPINFEVSSLGVSDTDGSNDAIDWSTLKANSRPEGLSNDAWDALFENVKQQTGDTWKDYVKTLGENAAYLSEQGKLVYEGRQLFNLEVLKADGFNSNSTLASALDMAIPATGFDLNLGRVYGSSLASRYETGALGRGWTHTYEVFLEETSEGNLLLHWSDGTVRTFILDEEGNYQSSSGDRGEIIKNADGTYSLQGQSPVSYTFRSDLLLDSIRDTDGNQITASYTNGQLSQLSHSAGQSLALQYNSDGKLSRVVNEQSGEETTYQYDASGEHLIEVKGSDQTLTYDYDPTGYALKSVANEAGNAITYTYNEFGHLASSSLNNGEESVSYDYDDEGAVTITNAENEKSKLFFDEQGNVSGLEDGLGRKYQFKSDSNGNLVEVLQPNGQGGAIAYDSHGNPSRITDALGQSVDLKFDSDTGNLQWLRDAKGNTLSYKYDDAGNLQSITYPDNSVEKFEFDDRGNLKEYTNRRGYGIRYEYHENGQIKHLDNDDGTFADYVYDTEGKLLSVTNVEGTTSLNYEGNDLAKIAYPNGRFLEFDYDEAGRRSKLVGSDGYVLNYRYDEAGRLEKLLDENEALIVKYQYDSVGRLEREDKGNGTYTTYEYYADGQLKNLVHYGSDDSVNSRFDYSYDEQGQLTGVTNLDGSWVYGYDATGQLTSAVFTSTNPEIPSQDLTYEYDAAGNRTKTIRNGVTTEYTTNESNQYETAGETSYEYDADGNLIGKTEGNQTWTYTYNNDNHLVKVVEPDSTITEYEYDPFGNRTATIRNGERSEYLVDPFGLADVVAEYEDTGLVAQYNHGLGLESRIDTANTSAYYDFNHLGSSVGLSGVNGSYLNRYSYLPFGQEFAETEAIPNPFEFVGQLGVMEEKNGLDFMRARYYDDAIGRFTALDPIHLRGGDTNLYRYVSNQPLSYSDPSGLFKQKVAEFAAKGAAKKAVKDALPSDSFGDRVVESGVAGAVAGGLGNALLGLKYGARFGLQGAAVGALVGFWSGVFSQLALEIPWVRRQKQALEKYASELLKDFKKDPLGTAKNLWDSLKEGANDLWDKLSESNTTSTASVTPEDKFGPIGYDAPDTPPGEEKRYITGDETLHYRIDFWNKEDAEVPTQIAIIRDKLDPDLDWSTLNFTNIGFLDWNVDLPGGQTIDTRIDMRPQEDLAVDVNATFDPDTGEIEWIFRAVDPVTGGDPADVFAGFLPPFNPETQYELGWVEFTIDPKADLPNGTEITNQAFVQFDLVGPFNPAPKPDPWLNTIDNTAPSSTVTALSSTLNNADFEVNWSGIDAGSGIASYDIYVSVNGSDFQPWLEGITETNATYNGEIGNSYAFYSIARDPLGHVEAAPQEADTSTTLTENNTSPIAEDDKTLTLNEDAAPISLNIAPPTDADGDPLTITVTTLPDSSRGEIRLPDGTSLALNQTLTATDLQNLTFAPTTDANGTAGTFAYSVDDGKGGITSQTITLEIEPVNDAPTVANPIANQTATEDASFNFVLPANTFTDVDAGDTLTYTATLANGDPLPTWLDFDPATQTLSGTPTNGDVGNLEIAIQASDRDGATADTSFQIAIANTNDNPAAITDTLSTLENQVLTFAATDLLTNDTDPDGDSLSVVAVSNAENGSVSLDANGNITFTPTDGFTGTARFDYTIGDGNNGFSSAGVEVTVEANDDPTPPSIAVEMLVDANGDGIFNNSEIGSAGENATFQVTIANTGEETVTLDAISHSQFDLLGSDLADLIGTTLAAGESAIATFTAPLPDLAQTTVGTDAPNTLNGFQDLLNSQISVTAANITGESVTAIDDANVTIDARDTIAGGLGDDIIFGGGADDVLRGDRNSRNSGGKIGGDDIIHGGAGNDRIGGKAGNDILFGDEGNDQIWGDDGDDIIRGGLGNDILTGDDFSGGTGRDTFVLAIAEGTDTIVDFKQGEDIIGLSGNLTYGQLDITRQGDRTEIKFGQETLAVLEGVTSTLTQDDFIKMT